MRNIVRFVCYLFLALSLVRVADSAPIDQNVRLKKSFTLADYFPLSVGNKWIFETDFRLFKSGMGIPTIYNRRGELTIEIVSFSQQNDSLIIYQTAEHFIGIEKRTENIGSSSQKDTAIVFDQYQQQAICEQISGRRSYGSSYINVDECHYVEYGNGSPGGYGFFFSTKRYLNQDSEDTLKVAMGTETGWIFLKNAGRMYFKDGTVGQSTSARLQIKLIKSEIKNSTSVTRQKNMTKRTFELIQNYPNPFNATTTIEFFQQKAGHVSIKIFSLMGQEMARLLDENMAAGAHKITWDAGKLSSGIYYYVLEAQDVKEVRKSILIK